MKAPIRFIAAATAMAFGVSLAAAQQGQSANGPTRPAGAPPGVQSSASAGHNNPENTQTHDTGHVKKQHKHKAATTPATSDANGKVNSTGSGSGKQTRPQ